MSNRLNERPSFTRFDGQPSPQGWSALVPMCNVFGPVLVAVAVGVRIERVGPESQLRRRCQPVAVSVAGGVRRGLGSGVGVGSGVGGVGSGVGSSAVGRGRRVGRRSRCRRGLRCGLGRDRRRLRRGVGSSGVRRLGCVSGVVGVRRRRSPASAPA